MPGTFETHGEGLAKSDAGKSRRVTAVLPRRGGMGQCGCRWHRRWKSDSGPEKEREAAWLRSEQARLGNVVLDSKKAQTLQGRIRRYSKEWLTFLDHPGVPPTNNLAEQAVRFLVILRKLTFGSRTRAGRAHRRDANRDADGQTTRAGRHPVPRGLVHVVAQRSGARCTLVADVTATRLPCREAGGRIDQAMGMAGPWAYGLLLAERRRLPKAFSVATNSRPSHNVPQRDGV